MKNFLEGFETSIIAFSNGENFFPCIPVKDYKKSGTGDKGLNTGGMGSVAPSPEFTTEHYADFEKNILVPTKLGINNEKLNFKGFYIFWINGNQKRMLSARI